jgi:hypothetical protein
VETLKPAKRNRKAQYFLQQRQKWFIDTGGGSNNARAPDNYAVALATGTFREWATNKLPEGEADVVLSLLGTLKAIVTANDLSFENVPINVRSQHTLQSFFGSIDEQQPPQQQWEFQDSFGAETMRSVGHPVPNLYWPPPPSTNRFPNGSGGILSANVTPGEIPIKPSLRYSLRAQTGAVYLT